MWSPTKGTTLRSWGLSKIGALGISRQTEMSSRSSSLRLYNAVQAHQPCQPAAPFWASTGNLLGKECRQLPVWSRQRRSCWKMLVYSLLLLPTLALAANPARMSSSWVGLPLFNLLPRHSLFVPLLHVLSVDHLNHQ